MEKIQQIFTNTPGLIGIVIAAIGLLLFIGTALNWEWVVNSKRRGSFLRLIFGARGEMFISSTMLILCGVVFFIFL